MRSSDQSGRFSLPGLIEHIRPSTAHVVCFWHAGTLKPEPNVKLLLHELAEQDRLTMVTLGNEVQRTFQFKVDEWEEKEQDELWGKMPVEYFVPVSRAIRANSTGMGRCRALTTCQS